MLALVLSLLIMSRHGNAANDFPVFVYGAKDPGALAANEASVGVRPDVPAEFQYQILKGPVPYVKDRLPWLLDDHPKLPRGKTCGELIANPWISMRRAGTTTVQNVPLKPMPAQQEWNGQKFSTNTPGISKFRVSSCCDQDACTNTCLEYPKGETWVLEISAPRWGYDTTKDPTRYQVSKGSSYAIAESKGDFGIWSVIRVQCLYCPIRSCIRNCSAGEYSTGYSAVTVSTFFPCFGGFLGCVDLNHTTTGGPAAEQHQVPPVRPRHVEHLHVRGALPVVSRLFVFFFLLCWRGGGVIGWRAGTSPRKTTIRRWGSTRSTPSLEAQVCPAIFFLRV